ncbi:MAG: hypothetical protein MZU95_10680 [Desulfomicrobium escambiense]|nr:hypothetical protein [Desulfomicrobium escambiense]
MRPDESFEKIVYSGALSQMLLKKRGPIIINNTLEFPDMERKFLRNNIYNALFVPIHGKDGIIGFIEERNRGGKEPYNEECVKNSERIARELMEILQSIYDPSGSGQGSEE